MEGLRVQGLTRRFGSRVAVRALSFEARAGEILGLLGPNGAGKTTTLSMITGLLDPETGSMMLDGQAFDPQRIRDRVRIGFCPQELVIWPELTVLEQLDLLAGLYGMGRGRQQRARDLLKALGLAERAKDRAASLSGGMKRRLNIALALMHDPQVIILDEPGAGLDPQSKVLVRDFIRALADEHIVVLATHDMDEAERLCHRVAILDHGGLLAEETPEQLRRDYAPGTVLALEPVGKERRETLTRVLGPLGLDLSWDCDRAEVRGPDLAEHVPEILQALGNPPHLDMELRHGTLEDVFLALTGRSLRNDDGSVIPSLGTGA